MKQLQGALERIKHYSSLCDYEVLRLYVSGRNRSGYDSARHIEAAVQWICCAQDAFEGGGVARSYSFAYNPYFRRKGWIHPYPETTGYIIPTLFDYAQRTGKSEAADRALRMADWESRVQLETGAVQGGTIDQPATPAVFNTGQVIFGWVRAFRETGRPHYLDSAVRAGRFLLKQQDEDGAWRKALSDYASSRMSFYTYNTRTAWALLELARAADNREFQEAAVKNVEFALTQQNPNGWFGSSCLTDPTQPLLHTIAYSIRGVLEIGALLKEARYIDKARSAADALLARQEPDGSLAGRFDKEWRPTVSWRCLTGEAQISGIWGRLYQLTGEPRYLAGMEKTNDALKRVQVLHTDRPGLYGGIAGSFPFHGPYGRFEMLNWAVKFFLDALMLEQSLRESRAHAA